MHVAGRALKTIRNRKRANHTSIFGLKEIEAQTAVICRATAEAAALGLVRDGSKLLRRNVHRYRIAKQALPLYSGRILALFVDFPNFRASNQLEVFTHGP